MGSIKQKPIDELEKSTNVLERQAYAKKLKDMIDLTAERIKKLTQDDLYFEYLIDNYPDLVESAKIAQAKQQEVNDYLISTEKELLKKLKIRLSEYDVYNQKVAYKCPICNEAPCVCNEIGLSDSVLD